MSPYEWAAAGAGALTLVLAGMRYIFSRVDSLIAAERRFADRVFAKTADVARLEAKIDGVDSSMALLREDVREVLRAVR